MARASPRISTRSASSAPASARRTECGSAATTSAASPSAFDAMRAAAYLSRGRSLDPREWLSVSDVFQMATAGGAALLGLPGLGRIAAGYQADLVMLDLRHVSYLPLHDPLLQVVGGESGLAIEGVMIGGRWALR